MSQDAAGGVLAFQDIDPVDKPSVHLDMAIGRAVYRASGIYGCRNALLAARMGVGGSLPPEWLQERFDAGHDHEPLIMGKIERKFGFRPYGFQMDVEVEVGDTAIIRGHIDGLDPIGNDPLVTHFEGEELRKPQRVSTLDENYDQGPIVIDAKALSQSSFETWQAKGFYGFPYYAWQQRIYVFGLDAIGVVMAIKNKNTDALIVDYYPKDSRHLAPIAPIMERVLEVEELARTQGESALFVTDCDQKQYPCPYWQFCWTREDKDKAVDDPEILKLIAAHVVMRDLHKAAEAQAKEQAAAIDREIVSLVGRRVATAKTTEGTVSTYHSSYTGPDWDAIGQKLGISGLEAKDTYTKTTPSPKFSVRVTKPRKKKEEKTDGAV